MIRPMPTDVALLAGSFFLGALIVAVVCALIFNVLLDLYRDDREMARAEREAWRSERREIINRIQHPHVMPTGVTRTPRDPDELARRRMQAADYATVGRIVPASTETNGDGDDVDLPGVP
jgi:hypothetical protein